MYLESALADKLEDYKLPENSPMTLDAGECSWDAEKHVLLQ